MAQTLWLHNIAHHLPVRPNTILSHPDIRTPARARSCGSWKVPFKRGVSRNGHEWQTEDDPSPPRKRHPLVFARYSKSSNWQARHACTLRMGFVVGLQQATAISYCCRVGQVLKCYVDAYEMLLSKRRLRREGGRCSGVAYMVLGLMASVVLGSAENIR